MRTRESNRITQAFSKILEHGKMNTALRRHRTQLIYYNLKDNTEKLVNVLNSLRRKSQHRAFKAVWLTGKVWKAEKQFRDEKDKYIKTFNDALAAKEKEVIQHKKKADDFTSKEDNYKLQINELKKQLENGFAKNHSGANTTASIKELQERVEIFV